MGFLDRLKKVFSSKHEEVESEETEFHDPHEKRLTEAFVQRQQSVIDDAMNELESNVQKVKRERNQLQHLLMMLEKLNFRIYCLRMTNSKTIQN